MLRNSCDDTRDKKIARPVNQDAQENLRDSIPNQFKGCSKMFKCKAHKKTRREAYMEIR